MAPQWWPGSRSTTGARTAIGVLALAAVLLLAACSEVSPTAGGRSGSTPATSSPGPAVDCPVSGSTNVTDLAYRRVDGVEPNLLSLDLYLPEVPTGCGPSPLVVYVHGGGLTTGDKANRIGDKVNLFTRQGWAFASVNYRLSPGAGTEATDPVRYPVHEQDVAAAIGWLRERAATYDLDPDRIALVGHSSGAYLVSLLSTDTSFLAAAGVDVAAVRCTVALDTEYDTVAQVALGGSQEALYRNALGDDPTVWAQASPLAHAADPGPHPSFLIVTRGPPQRTDGAMAFADALVAGGTDATAIDVSPLDHAAVNDAVGAPDDVVVTPPLLDHIRSCMKRT